MHPETHLGFEEWLPRRTALLTALGIWMAGFALAGASAWRIQHPGAGRTNEVNEASTSAVATQDEATADIAESEGAMLIPEDTVLGRRMPERAGATLMQSR